MSVVPKGSKILVTGVSGYIGSNIADQLVAIGYTVRGTSRSKASAQWIVDSIENKYGSGKIEILTVTDMAADDAYDEAMKGVGGVIHVATVGSATEGFDSDPHKVITPVIASTTNILSSAKKEPGVKAVVLTSSSTAVAVPPYNEPVTLTEGTWNEAVVQKAWNDPAVDGYTVYGASKTEGEKHFWQRAKDEKLPFQVSTVIPGANFGPISKPNGEFSSSTGSWVPMVYEGQTDFIFQIPAEYFIHVVDCAKLHVIALTDPEANGRRLFAYGHPWSWSAMVEIIQKLYPSRKLPTGPQNESKNMLKVVPREFSEGLLKKHYGHGFLTLDQTVKEGTATLK